jgi:hypothetical protein
MTTFTAGLRKKKAYAWNNQSNQNIVATIWISHKSVERPDATGACAWHDSITKIPLCRRRNTLCAEDKHQDWPNRK